MMVWWKPEPLPLLLALYRPKKTAYDPSYLAHGAVSDDVRAGTTEPGTISDPMLTIVFFPLSVIHPGARLPDSNPELLARAGSSVGLLPLPLGY